MSGKITLCPPSILPARSSLDRLLNCVRVLGGGGEGGEEGGGRREGGGGRGRYTNQMVTDSTKNLCHLDITRAEPIYRLS